MEYAGADKKYRNAINGEQSLVMGMLVVDAYIS
jgi:hypothetical protein